MAPGESHGPYFDSIPTEEVMFTAVDAVPMLDGVFDDHRSGNWARDLALETAVAGGDSARRAR